MDNAAPRAHFSACEIVFTVIHEFDTFLNEETGDRDVQRSECISRSEVEMGNALRYLNQANELALRARICRVSPYLFLIGTGSRLPSGESDIEFADLRTIDVVDLPRVVNAVSPEKKSGSFAKYVRNLRVERNHQTHLGGSERSVDAKLLASQISRQFVEL